MPLPALLRPPQYGSVSVYLVPFAVYFLPFIIYQAGNALARSSLSVCLINSVITFWW